MDNNEIEVGVDLEESNIEEYCESTETVSHNYNYSYTDVFELEDINERRLYLNTEVDETSIDSMAYHIMRYNRLDKGLSVEDRKPIILFINSPGGSVTNGFGLIDTILTSKTPVYTVNQGICYSMGYLIFLAGKKRYSMPHSTFLMHDGSSFAWDSSAKLKDRVDFESKQMEEQTKQYIMSRTNISNDLYDEKYRIEWYMYPNEAKEHNIVDYIVGVDCELDEIIN